MCLPMMTRMISLLHLHYHLIIMFIAYPFFFRSRFFSHSCCVSLLSLLILLHSFSPHSATLSSHFPTFLFLLPSGFELVHEFQEGCSAVILANNNLDLIPAHYQSPQISKGEWPIMSKDSLFANDSWSLGCFVFEAFHPSSFNKREDLLSPRFLPNVLAKEYKRLVASTPKSRLPPSVFVECQYFAENDLVQTVKFLDSLALKSEQEKETFLRSLTTKIPSFPTVCHVL